MIIKFLKTIYLKIIPYKKLWLSVSIVLACVFLYIATRSVYQVRQSGYPMVSTLFDAIAHFIGFAGLSITLRLYFEKNTREKKIISKTSILVIIIVGIWGFLCESIQFFVPTRGVELIDYAANILAAPVVQILIDFILQPKYK